MSNNIETSWPYIVVMDLSLGGFFNYMNRTQKPIVIWLFIGAFLVLSMVVVGGITRLTQSGLSMVEWHLFMGSIPPTSEAEWLEVFEKYKDTPEFQIVNPDFDVEDFKSIFWWEYIHRVLGRLIGLVFIIPFVIFLLQKRIDKPLLKKLILILILGGFQGFLGWYMVKSGLVDDPHVSHYRLAAHLSTALLLFAFILWTSFDLIYTGKNEEGDFRIISKVRRWSILGLVVLGIQIIYGAFVAGLKAGLYYNTWPKMGLKWVPSEVGNALLREGWISLFDNITVVQFIHRYLAWIVVVFVVLIFIEIQKSAQSKNLVKGAYYLLAITIVQVALGIFTLIYQVPVSLGVIHQLGSVLLLGGFVYVLHRSNVKYEI